MDDIAAGVNNFDEMIPAQIEIFDCLRESGLKLSAHKCEFGTTKIDYIGSTITPKRVSPESAKIEKFLGQIRMPNTVKQKKRSSLKHPQTVSVVERSHSALKSIFEFNTIEQWNDWFKYVQLATFIHNTSYHSAIDCSPTVLFHGREPIKPLDLRFNNTLIERFSPNSEYVIALQDAMNKKFSETKFKLTEMYNKYRTYYDCKAEAKPLALFSYCLLLNQN